MGLSEKIGAALEIVIEEALLIKPGKTKRNQYESGCSIASDIVYEVGDKKTILNVKTQK